MIITFMHRVTVWQDYILLSKFELFLFLERARKHLETIDSLELINDLLKDQMSLVSLGQLRLAILGTILTILEIC